MNLGEDHDDKISLTQRHCIYSIGQITAEGLRIQGGV